MRFDYFNLNISTSQQRIKTMRNQKLSHSFIHLDSIFVNFSRKVQDEMKNRREMRKLDQRMEMCIQIKFLLRIFIYLVNLHF